jgi:lysyl-tRNA synthetase class 2
LFQICPCFRKGERGRLHREEFTMLEWYHVDWSYLELMRECEEMVRAVAGQMAKGTGQGSLLHREGKKISLSPPWQRLTVEDAFQRYAGMSAIQAADKGMFDEILVEKIEPNLGWQTPVFFYDYPISLASLARPKKEDPEVAERFELYIGGVELANGFSELTDATVQRQRFSYEIDKAAQQRRNLAMPEKFLKSLEQLPKCAGIALGLDRLLMLLMGVDNLADVLPFSDGDL